MSKDSTDLFAPLVELLVLEGHHNVVIIAGHYCLSEKLSELSNEGESEISSFRTGVKAYRFLKSMNRKCKLVLWINDIGIETLARQEIKASYLIPQNYLDILGEYQVSIQDVEILFETTMRNKASVWFRKIYKRTPEKFQIMDNSDANLVRCIDPVEECPIIENVKAYTILTDKGEPLVMKEGPHPKCNLILATLFATLEKGNEGALFLNIFNDIYIERIRLGIHVARNVYNLNSRFINCFVDGQEIYSENF